MKNDRQAETAKRFNITGKCERLETALLAIPGVAEVDFDLDGFYDNLRQVIFLTKYDLDPAREDYYAARREMLEAIERVAKTHGLSPTGDTVEDYGQHFYFVRSCDRSWILERFTFTFGTDSRFPYREGWVEVLASDAREAADKFRARFPDRPGSEGILNCAFVYSSEEWARIGPEAQPDVWKHGPGYWEVIE